MGREGIPGGVIGCAVAGVGLVILLLAFMIAGTANIDAGHVGIVKTWGATSNDIWGPGFHLKTPFAQDVIEVDVRTQNHQFKEAAAASKEQQNVYVDGTVNYHIDQGKVVGLYNTVGLDFAAKVFDPAFQDYLKEVVPQYPASDVFDKDGKVTQTGILQHRNDIREAVKTKLTENAKTYGIDVIDVFITNIHFDADYSKAIEAKAVAQQQLEQAKIAAQTTVTNAQAQADAQVRAATADAQANGLRSQNLSQLLIDYLIAQKWDGKLPQVTGGSPLINFTAK